MARRQDAAATTRRASQVPALSRNGRGWPGGHVSRREPARSVYFRCEGRSIHRAPHAVHEVRLHMRRLFDACSPLISRCLAIAGTVIAPHRTSSRHRVGDLARFTITGPTQRDHRDMTPTNMARRLCRWQEHRTSGRLPRTSTFSFTSTGAIGGGAPRFMTSRSTRTADVKTTEALRLHSTSTAARGSHERQHEQLDLHGVLRTTEPAPYANWDAFAAAHPTWIDVSRTSPFVIADAPGSYGVSDVEVELALRNRPFSRDRGVVRTARSWRHVTGKGVVSAVEHERAHSLRASSIRRARALGSTLPCDLE